VKKFYIILFVLTITASSFAQIKFGTDVYSRYIWRGFDFGDSPAIQPSLTYTMGDFSIGAWGSYALPSSGSTYAENDLWASYAISTETSGSFSLIITDYYIPSYGIPFGFFKTTDDNPAPGAGHTFEGGVSYSGPAKFPISISAFMNLTNDEDNSVYLQAGYPITIDDATVTFTAGFVPSKSAYYLTDKGNIVNLGIIATKSISITEKFAVPITVSYIGNPSQDKTYLVFGASFLF
jgi:hypothetical protein